MEAVCNPLNFTLDGNEKGLPRCLYGTIISGIYIFYGLFLVIAGCVTRYETREYNVLLTEEENRKFPQRCLIIIWATTFTIVLNFVELIYQITFIYRIFVIFIFLEFVTYISCQIIVLATLFRGRILCKRIIVFNLAATVLILLSFAGFNNSDWFFQSKLRTLELVFFILRLFASCFILFICACPDLTVDINTCPEGRLFIPCESSSKIVSAWHRFRYLWSYTWPKSLKAKTQLILCFCIMISARVSNVFIPYYAKLIVDKLTSSPLPEFSDVASTVAVLVTLQMLFSTNGILETVQRQVLFVTVQQESVRQVQIMTFNHLLHLKYEWHVKRKTGEILRSSDRGANSLTNLINWICFNIGPTLLDIVIAVIYFGVAFNWIFSLLVLACMVIYLTTTIGITEWRTKFRQGMNKKENETHGRAIDSLLNYEQVKSNVGEDHETGLYEQKIKSYQATQLKVQHSLAVLNSSQSIVMVTGSAIGTLLCVQNVLVETFSVGDYVMFGAYIAQLYLPLNWFGTMYRMIQAAFIDTENLMDLLSEKPEQSDPTKPVKLQDGPLSFELEDVTFKYREDNRCILKNLSFKIPAGKTWALVGESGCGKSTIARLLTGMLEPTEGRILINDYDIKSIGFKQVRKLIGTVSQDCPLFNATIKENIRYSRLTAADDQLEDAASKAMFKYDKFENGIETTVGERGLALSGGEKQRLSIARVFLKNPNAIILDEATSSLDSITEKQISESLMDVAKGKTCLIIAHRLSTITHADSILLISDGEILESGTHHELLNMDSRYSKLWNEQQKIE